MPAHREGRLRLCEVEQLLRRVGEKRLLVERQHAQLLLQLPQLAWRVKRGGERLEPEPRRSLSSAPERRGS